MGDELPKITQRQLSEAQRAMLALLGNPKIVGSAGTPTYLIDDPAEARLPFLNVPYGKDYRCPVVIVLDRLRQVMPNGDLVEVNPERMGPAETSWAS